jgi:DNA-binding NarL/FixJ family response regulator
VRIAILETDPIFCGGLISALERDPNLRVVGTAASMEEASSIAVAGVADVWLVDASVGVGQVAVWMGRLRSKHPETCVLVWDNLTSEAARRQLLRSGVRGWIGRKLPLDALCEALRAEVMTPAGPAAAVNAMVQSAARRLTLREREITELIRQGLKNREIAERMGITAGTVKVHLMHVFEKTGLRGRVQLAECAAKLLEATDCAPAEITGEGAVGARAGGGVEARAGGGD